MYSFGSFIISIFLVTPMTVYSHNDINIEGRTFQGTAICMQVRTVFKKNVYLFHLRLLNQSFNKTQGFRVELQFSGGRGNR